jgi:hypothetical protein
MTTGACRRAPDTFGSGRGVVTLVHGDQAAGDAEHAALDDAFHDVVQSDARAHLRPERRGVDFELLHADELHAEDADRDEDHRQQRHRDNPAGKARRDHATHRIHGHHFHGRQLIGRTHQPISEGERRAGAAANSSAVTTGPTPS